CRRAETACRRQRNDWRAVVDLHDVVLVSDAIDGRCAAGDPEELPGRVDLEGTDREKQSQIGRFFRAQRVINVERRLVAFPGGVRRDRQVWPLYAGYRHEAVGERWSRLNIVPARGAAVCEEEWLDRIASLFRLDSSVDVEQRFARVACDADDR